MNIKCTIIDDEPIAREVIRTYLARLQDFEVVREHEDAMQALSFLKQHRIDLIFLDIQMPGLNGIEFLRSLKHPPNTIITTAHREFALDGFDLQVIDYLLKPISFERFLQAMDRFYDSLRAPFAIGSVQGPSGEEAFIYLNDNKKTHKVYLKDIILVESRAEYVQIHTPEKRMTIRSSLSKMALSLPGDRFIRTHHSYIVSLSHVTAFTASVIELGDLQVPVSRSYKHQVNKALAIKRS